MSILDWFKGSESPPPQNQPDALHDELHQTIVTYGVSNRTLSKDGKSLNDSRISAPIDSSVHYFKQTVQVSGTAGNFNTDKTDAPEVITKAQFDQGIADQVKAANGRLGIYTHGIRNAVGDAGKSAAELAADTGEPFVTEDWASTKAFGLFWAAHQEKSDDQASFNSQPMIDASVEDLASKFGAQNIDMVAHSRGSMNQIRALADLQSMNAGAVHSATFAHSDVDVSDFELSLPSFQNAAQHVNVLYNPKDHALKLSEIQRFGQVATLGNNSQEGFEESERLGRSGLTAGLPGSNSYMASKVPNYFSIAKDKRNDITGHEFSPSLAASMIANPNQFNSFSTLMRPGQLDTQKCSLSPIAGIGHVISAVPEFALKVMSVAREKMDIVSDSPEVQKYFDGNVGTDFAMLDSGVA
jgi:hypothetical protein